MPSPPDDWRYFRQTGIQTMSESKRIAEQARLMFEGEAWHGPAVSEVLQGVDARQASSHPIAGAHSIWELVLHLSATQSILLRRLRGQSAGLNQEEFWPAVEQTTDAAWTEAVERLKKQERELEQAIRVFPDAQLDARLTTEGTSAYNNFHGHIQHNAYHAGQISLLKKAAALQ
jgi:uncharacterized damage-inducible protein DinB